MSLAFFTTFSVKEAVETAFILTGNFENRRNFIIYLYACFSCTEALGTQNCLIFWLS